MANVPTVFDYVHANHTVSNGGLTVTNNTFGFGASYTTSFKPSGKWYWEIRINTSDAGRNIIPGATVSSIGTYPGQSGTTSWGYYGADGTKVYSGTFTAFGSTFTTGDVIGIALDLDAGKIWFSKNNVWQGSGDPAAGTNPAFTSVSGEVKPAIGLYATNSQITGRFLGSSQSYAAPSGFSPLDRPLVFSGASQLWGLRMGVDVIHSWTDAPVLTSAVDHNWGDAGLLSASLSHRWRDMVVLAAACDNLWGMTTTVDMAVYNPWALTSSLLTASVDEGWNLLERDLVTAKIKQTWWGDFDPSTQSQTSAVVTVYEAPEDGEALNQPGALLGRLTSVSGLSIEASLDQYAISATLQVRALEDYLLCEPGTVVNISGVSPGTVFVLRVDGRYRNRSGADTDTYTIELLSPSAWLDAPYAEMVSMELVGSASTIAAQPLSGKLSISWETVDWYIGAGVFTVENQVPLTVLRTLASSIGGVVQTDTDGTLRIISSYTVPVDRWSSQTGTVIDEATTVTSSADTFEYRPGYNRFRVSDDEGTSNLSDIRVVIEDVSDYVKLVKAQIPDLSKLKLTHTGGGWVTIESNGRKSVTLPEPEIVEIVQGEGRTANTITSLGTHTWHYVDLGAVDFEASGLITAGAGESLLSLTYSYEEQEWKVASPEIEQVQFILEIDNG